MRKSLRIGISELYFSSSQKHVEVMGGATLITFRSTVEGYNERFGREVKIDDTIKLSGLGREEWPDFIGFLLNVY